MNKLEVGMYVRTKYGFIDEVIIEYQGYCNNPNCQCKHVSCKYNYYDEDEIVKASHNIIDLIEVGDYVNGHQVYEVDRVCCRITLNGGDIGSEAFRLTYLRPALGKNMGIKSIVTKEMYSNVEYRVETD